MVLFQLANFPAAQVHPDTYVAADMVTRGFRPYSLLWAIGSKYHSREIAILDNYPALRDCFSSETKKVMDVLYAARQAAREHAITYEEQQTLREQLHAALPGVEWQEFRLRFAMPQDLYRFNGILASGFNVEEKVGLVSYWAGVAEAATYQKNDSLLSQMFGGFSAEQIAQSVLLGIRGLQCGDINYAFAGTLAEAIGLKAAGLVVFASGAGHVVLAVKGEKEREYYIVDYGNLYKMRGGLDTLLEGVNREYGIYNPFVGSMDYHTAHVEPPSYTALKRVLGWTDGVGGVEAAGKLFFQKNAIGGRYDFNLEALGRRGYVGLFALKTPFSLEEAFGLTLSLRARDAAGKAYEGLVFLPRLDFALMAGKTGPHNHPLAISRLVPVEAGLPFGSSALFTIKPLEVGIAATYATAVQPSFRLSSNAGVICYFNEEKNEWISLEVEAVHSFKDPSKGYYNIGNLRPSPKFTLTAQSKSLSVSLEHAPGSWDLRTRLAAEFKPCSNLLFFGNITTEEGGLNMRTRLNFGTQISFNALETLFK